MDLEQKNAAMAEDTSLEKTISRRGITKGQLLAIKEEGCEKKWPSSTVMASSDFTYKCHNCHKPNTAPFAISGKKASCRHCNTALVIPPRIGIQMRWLNELPSVSYSPPSKVSDLFVSLTADQLRKLFAGLEIKCGNIDQLWVAGKEFWLDTTPVLQLNFGENGDRTGTLPMLESTGLIRQKAPRYGLTFIKRNDETIFCAGDDGETGQMLASSRTSQILNTIMTSVDAGQVKWDESQPLLGDNPAVLERYNELFKEYLDLYLNIPKIDRSIDYDQLLIFEPTFSGYYRKYGVTSSQIKNEEDFGQLMGSLPIADGDEILSDHPRDPKGLIDIGKLSIGQATFIGFNFWSKGKLPGRLELYNGERQINFQSIEQLLKIDQIVNGSFTCLYIARIQGDDFLLWYTLSGR